MFEAAPATPVWELNNQSFVESLEPVISALDNTTVANPSLLLRKCEYRGNIPCSSSLLNQTFENEFVELGDIAPHYDWRDYKDNFRIYSEKKLITRDDLPYALGSMDAFTVNANSLLLLNNKRAIVVSNFPSYKLDTYEVRIYDEMTGDYESTTTFVKNIKIKYSSTWPAFVQAVNMKTKQKLPLRVPVADVHHCIVDGLSKI